MKATDTALYDIWSRNTDNPGRKRLGDWWLLDVSQKATTNLREETALELLTVLRFRADHYGTAVEYCAVKHGTNPNKDRGVRL